MSVGSLEPKFRQALCIAIGRQDLMTVALSFKPADDIAFKQHLKDIFKEKTFAQWQEIFGKIDACVEPVLSFEGTVTHPLFVERKCLLIWQKKMVQYKNS